MATDLLGPASAPNAVTARLAEYRTIDTWFKDCSTPASQDGTAVQAAWLNGIMAQLRAAIRGNGNRADGTGPLVPEVNTTDGLLLGAVQLLIARGQPNCGADTGSADALAVGPATPWPEYKAGARIWVIKSSAAGANATAAPTLAVSGLAAVTVVRRDGSALLPGDLPAGAAFCAIFDGTYFRLVSLTWSDVAGAVQSGKWVYGAATGTGNAAAVTLFPVQAPVDGTEVLVKWPSANTVAAPTLNVAGVGTKTVVRQGGGTIQVGDLAGYVPLIWDAANGWWRVNGFVASDLLALIAANAPAIVSGNPTLYVRTDGSDSNNGSANTAAGAFLTIQAALNYAVSRFVTQGKTLTIQLGIAGTYAAPTSIPAAAGALAISGSTTNQGAGYNISGGGLAGSPAVINVQGANITLSGVTITNTSSSTSTIAALSGGSVILSNTTLAHAGSNSASDLIAYPGGSIAIVGQCTFQSSSASGMNAFGGNISVNSNVAITIGTGNNYATAFAIANNCGTVTFNSGSYFIGTASGVRYSATLNGVVNTFGGGTSFLPGGTAGTTATGGQYA